MSLDGDPAAECIQVVCQFIVASIVVWGRSPVAGDVLHLSPH